MHDRVIVLREHHLPILESPRLSLWHRPNARLGFENVSGGQRRCAVFPAISTPNGETCSRWRTPPCPRSPTAATSHERCRSETQGAHGSFFHLDATLELGLRDLPQEIAAMVVKSIGKHQHLKPVRRVRQSDGVDHQILCIAARSHLLASRFFRDRPIRRALLGPAMNTPHGLDNLCQLRKSRPQPVYGLQKLHQLTRGLQAAHAR